MSTSEKMRFSWMESNCLNNSFSGAERTLRGCFRNTVDKNLTSSLEIMGHSGKIIPFRMPTNTTDHVFKS